MKAKNPRHGSLQVWPRKRAKREYPRIRRWATRKDAKPLGFVGYKAGMTQVVYVDNKKTSITKGKEVVAPVTIIECPPIKVFGARAYAEGYRGEIVAAQTLSVPSDKEFGRKLHYKGAKSQKVPSLDAVDASKITRVVLICYSQPKLTTIGKKKPEIFELAIGGSVADQLAYAKEHVGKDLAVSDIFKAGVLVDAHAVSKGFGFQGPVARFGIAMRSHKSEKSRRNPGSLGGWKSQAHTMPRVAHAGQTGYHTRTDYNKQILLVEADSAKINPKGGIPRYGEVRNTYILLRGSVPGARKRLIRLNAATRGDEAQEVPVITHVSVESRQS